MGNPEFRLDPDLAARHQGGEGRAQGTACGELVVGAAAERLFRRVAAQQPMDFRCRRLILQAREIDQRANSRMTGTEHRDSLAGVACTIAAQHVGHAVGDAFLNLALADRRQAVGAGRVGREPCSRGIDHGIGAKCLGPLAVLVADLERRRRAALGADAILQHRPRRERLEILRHQLGAGRVLIGLRLVPAGGFEQALGRAIDIVFPGREHADVTPLAHGVSDIGTGFEDDRLQAAFQHMRGGSESHGAAAKDRYGLRYSVSHTILQYY